MGSDNGYLRPGKRDVMQKGDSCISVIQIGCRCINRQRLPGDKRKIRSCHGMCKEEIANMLTRWVGVKSLVD